MAYGAVGVLAVSTPEEYAHLLEARFHAGESAASIRTSFMTNGIFTAYDILPYCYIFDPDTNDLAAAVSCFEKKVEFLQSVYSRDHRFMPQNFFDEVLGPFESKISDLRRVVFRYARINTGIPIATNLSTRLSLAEYAYIRNANGFINARERFGHPRKYVDCFLHNNTAFKGRERELANYQAYGIAFDDLVAELSTNRTVKANENFRHAITEDVSFATDNLLAAERNIRRKNNVLKIITLSCMFKTNELNRSLSYTYCSSLTNLYAQYEDRSPESLNLTIEDKTNLMRQLREAIEIYTIDNPFIQGNSGENPR